jgi:AmpE protein
MKLIIILITVALEHFDEYLGGFLAKLKQARQWAWFHRVTAILDKALGGMGAWNGPAGVSVVIAVPVVAVWIIFAVLDNFFGLFTILLSLLILVYCMGPKDLMVDLAQVAGVMGGSDESAKSSAVQAFTGSAEAVVPESRGRAVVEAAMVSACERAFAVICWFAVLGWKGALIYRLVSELCGYKAASDAFTAGAQLIHKVLAWIPARLTALALALSGNIAKGLQGWRVLETLSLDENATAIKNAGLGALQFFETSATDAERIQSAQALLQKSLFIFIGIIAALYVLVQIIF